MEIQSQDTVVQSIKDADQFSHIQFETLQRKRLNNLGHYARTHSPYFS
jgi:hypothetical protein